MSTFNPVFNNVFNPVFSSVEGDSGWNVDFTRGEVPQSLVFTRASSGSYFNSNGILTTAGVDTLRLDTNPLTLQQRGLLIEGASTNGVANSSFSGSSVGGALGTGWSTFVTDLVNSVVGVGTEYGMEYVDIRISGTSDGSSGSNWRPAATTGVSASLNQLWTASAYARIVGGSKNNFSSFGVYVVERNSGGTVLSQGYSEYLPTLSSTLTRMYHTRTLSSATVANVTANFAIDSATAGAVDITIRFYAPQLEQSNGPTSFIRTTGSAATRSYDMPIINTSLINFKHSEGTVIIEYELVTNTKGNQELYDFVNNAETQYMASLYPSGTATNVRSVNNTGTVFDITSQSDIRTPGVIHRHGLAYKNNNTAICVDGATIFEDTNCLMFSSGLTKWLLGMGNSSGANPGNLYIRKIFYIPFRFPNDQLQLSTVV